MRRRILGRVFGKANKLRPVDQFHSIRSKLDRAKSALVEHVERKVSPAFCFIYSMVRQLINDLNIRQSSRSCRTISMQSKVGTRVR